MVEIKVPKEVREYHESIFFGLSLRQFGCAAAAVGTAVGLYFVCAPFLGSEITSWVCILGALPLAFAGFFTYNGMPFEKFVWAVFKSQILYAAPRGFKAKNFYYDAFCAKERQEKPAALFHKRKHEREEKYEV